MPWDVPIRAVILQLGLVALVASAEAIRGPTIPPCPTRQTASPTTLAPLSDATNVAEFDSDEANAIHPAQGNFTDPSAADAAWREILELRRTHGGLLQGALWHDPDHPGVLGAGDADATDWEEAEFSRALRQVIGAPATR